MQLSQLLFLTCSTLALATPAYPQSKGEWHRSYKPGCASASTSLPHDNDSSSAAVPYPLGPTATAGATSAGGVPIESSSPSEEASTPSSSYVAAPSSTSAAAAAQSSSTAPPPVGGGATYTSTFTQYVSLITLLAQNCRLRTNPYVRYGAGDSFGSGNCNTATAACGWYSNPGFNAAASQNLFGVGPGAGAGPACGLCFQLTAKTNPYNNNAPLNGTKSIVVKVNNLCPADGNPLCSQSSLTPTNSLGTSEFLFLYLHNFPLRLISCNDRWQCQLRPLQRRRRGGGVIRLQWRRRRSRYRNASQLQRVERQQQSHLVISAKSLALNRHVLRVKVEKLIMIRIHYRASLHMYILFYYVWSELEARMSVASVLMGQE